MHAFIFLLFLSGCTDSPPATKVAQWTSYEIKLTASQAYQNAYTDVECWATFTNTKGDTLIRPAFWNGDSSWIVRFAPPDTGENWSWKSFALPEDQGLHHQSGQLQSVAYQGTNALLTHGLLEMSKGKRNVVHKDGEGFLLVGDTPWALPFRATMEQARIYAKDRQKKGFNAALLMSVQPDMKAEGPNARNTVEGFARGFSDLSSGHINQLEPAYFQYLDSLIQILLAHEIVPVYQPVFHGFGWKGLQVLGNTIEPTEYVRYCKYLLARYGSQPAFWLLAGDNGGNDPGVKESGEMMEKWDCYQQPTGLHYNPCDDFVADWAKNNPLKHCMHYNKSWQEADWLDFQWAQTGHNGTHQLHKVERMYANLPVKASANGEPTYEGMNDGKNGLGWWQGEEAWSQLFAGGTMGVVYGAAGLWQWKVTADEPGWTAWASQEKSWKEAMEMEGSTYVGYLGQTFEGLDFVDMQKRSDLSENGIPLLTKDEQLYAALLSEGDSLRIKNLASGLNFRYFDPKDGSWTAAQQTEENQLFRSPIEGLSILIVTL